MPETSGGKYYEGPVSNSRTALASAARTTTAAGTAFNTEDITELEAELTVSAASGTNPTLDVVLETKTPNGAYYTVAAFAQQTGTGTVGKVFTGLGSSCRWSWTIGGTDTPSFTFAVATTSQRGE